MRAYFFFFFFIIEIFSGIFIGNILRNMYIVYDNMYFVWEEYWYEGKYRLLYVSYFFCFMFFAVLRVKKI